MAQIVKWAYLGAAIVALLVTAAAVINSISPSDIITNFGTSVNSFLSSSGSSLTNVRGAINYFLGTHLIFDIALFGAFSLPFIKFGFRVVITFIKWLSQ